MAPCIYIDNSDSTDPAANLALEEYALRHMDPEYDYLMLYRNDPSVIVGRNQNVLEEVNDTYVRRKRIPVFRRISGGGTVYHEPGNLNFSFITRYEPYKLHNYRYFNEPVVHLLQSLGVPAVMNDRNDILAEGKKISGSAQFTSSGRMISHGTLLFDVDLGELVRVLMVGTQNITSRSQKSVRSRVTNISGYIDRSMSILEFKNFMKEGLLKVKEVSETFKPGASDHREIDKIRKNRYGTWDWNVGRSPRFQIRRTHRVHNMTVSLVLDVHKGHIQNLEITGCNGAGADNQPDFSSLAGVLSGVRYDPDDIKQTLHDTRVAGLSGVLSPDRLVSILYGE